MPSFRSWARIALSIQAEILPSEALLTRVITVFESRTETVFLSSFGLPRPTRVGDSLRAFFAMAKYFDQEEAEFN